VNELVTVVVSTTVVGEEDIVEDCVEDAVVDPVDDAVEETVV
jgi:hypothetical protein